MRTDEAYLADMLEAARDVERYVGRCLSASDFARSDELKWAVLQRLAVIGEAAGWVSTAFRAAHPEIEWPAARALRNFIVHGYFDVDWNMIWETAVRNIPVLRRELEKLLSTDSDATAG